VDRRCYFMLGAMLAIAPAMTLSGFYFQDRGKETSRKAAVAPALIYKEEPVYPEAQQRAKIAGTVVLSLEVSAEGRAENISVSRGLDPELDANAIDCLRKWRFAPGLDKEGTPIPVNAVVEINFKLQ
jgi:TonB family protein